MIKFFILILIKAVAMRMPLRMFYLAIIQVILTSFIIYYFVSSQYRELSDLNVKTLETFLITQKEQELKNYIAIALSSVEHMDELAEDKKDVIKVAVANIFKNMLYNGDDGYFFIYDDKAIAIVHPKQPDRVGE
ncbi:MAG: two-component system NarL family sensor kinase, partial [Psychroserpens sp.]